MTTVGAGRAAMMKQRTLDGMIANFQPAILLTGPDKLTEAEQLLTTITPAATSNVVPESLRRLVPVGDANITGNGWYLFADPSIAPTFVYALLDGFEGPRLTSENTFGVQGMRVKLEHDFGVIKCETRFARVQPADKSKKLMGFKFLKLGRENEETLFRLITEINRKHFR